MMGIRWEPKTLVRRAREAARDAAWEAAFADIHDSEGEAHEAAFAAARKVLMAAGAKDQNATARIAGSLAREASAARAQVARS